MAYLGIVVVASIIGFLGNEAVALFRIKVGKDIGSAPLWVGHYLQLVGTSVGFGLSTFLLIVIFIGAPVVSACRDGGASVQCSHPLR